MLDRNVEQVDRDLEDLLAIPSSLFRHGDMSFSTDSNKDISAVARHFLMGSAIPSDLPDFGICLTRRGNNLFCTVVSKKQKIIVHAFVKNVQGGASWEDLKFSLREARDLARLYEVNDKPVNFIVQGEARHVAI